MRDSDINKRIENKLKNWGLWHYKELISDAVGYPAKSIEGKLIDGGGMIIHSTTKEGRILVDSDLIAINRIIGDLLSDKHEKTTGIVLQLNYIGQSSQLKKAKLLGLSETRYKSYLRSGKLYVAGRLNIKNN